MLHVTRDKGGLTMRCRVLQEQLGAFIKSRWIAEIAKVRDRSCI